MTEAPARKKPSTQRVSRSTAVNATCDACDLAGQVKGSGVTKVVEVSEPQEGSAGCTVDGCGRQFVFTMRAPRAAKKANK